MDTTTPADVVETESAPVDEAAVIEERRRKREAIKAKYKNQSQDLRIQALQLGNDSGSGTPKTEIPDIPSARSRKLSPMATSPKTPQDVTNPSSPGDFAIHSGVELANDAAHHPAVDDNEGPSAADYDPTGDMQDDRARNVQRFGNEEQPSASYDETKEIHRDVLVPETTPQDSQETKPQKEFDMFAMDDEDDMFAANWNDKPKETARPIPLHQDGQVDLSLQDNWTDPDGYYRVMLGELMNSKYRVRANLGRGMFSSVVRATDTQTNNLVAIKIIRSNETMQASPYLLARKAGMKEIGILNQLADADPDNKKHIIRLERYFDHRGHLCMVFENLNINLREVLKKFGRDVGLNLKAVRSYAHQMFLGLTLFRKCNILHADLKPDNVLVNDAHNLLKICDLGSAADASEADITPYLVSRFYRAPEIILGMPYDFAIDMWSIGCTLYELYTGKILFTGRNNNQMLRSIMECRGKFSNKMLRKCQFALDHFDDSLNNFRSMEKDRITNRDIIRVIQIVKPTKDLKSRLITADQGLSEAELKEVNLFIDLLDRCLQLNPERRITPIDALKHPFISRAKP
ncbi:putative Serine/threonine-protein kinase prp4 [Lineolata rhizophorae]|uniref:non-specific serine/threonine protein kinase n=1 Tax=Lineolata rhizophorae TaxID=578093 RepID=A0A6A6P231_9PEZI|nr:putative Serine/threonine-protein kinase prp4 [Lineolata rhizophorae]